MRRDTRHIDLHDDREPFLKALANDAPQTERQGVPQRSLQDANVVETM